MNNRAPFKFPTLILTVFLLFSLFSASCGNDENTGEESQADETIPVEVLKAETAPLVRTLDFSDVLKAGSDITVSAETGGTIAYIEVDEGEAAQAGGLVVKIDDTTPTLNYSAAQAQLSSAESTLAIAEDPMREGQIAQLESALDAAQAQFEVAESGLDRATRLFDEGAISESELESAQAGYESAKAGRDSAREILDLALEGSRDEEIEAARSAVNAARANVALAADQVAKTSIKSPIDGTVTDIYFEEGELIGPGTPVFRVLNADHLTLEIGIGDREIPYVDENMDVVVTVDAFPGREFQGTVTMVGVVSDPMTGTYPVEITVPNDTGELNAGMVARATIQFEKIEDGIVVPVQAIDTSEGTTRVFIEDNLMVEERTVEVGLYVGDKASIIDGLLPGELVVVRGNQYIEDGDEVRVVSEWESLEY